MTSYGKRGGDGPTRGKRANYYEVTLPDGRKVRVQKYKIDITEGWSACYRDRTTGDWIAGSFIRADKHEVEMQCGDGGMACPAQRCF